MRLWYTEMRNLIEELGKQKNIGSSMILSMALGSSFSVGSYYIFPLYMPSFSPKFGVSLDFLLSLWVTNFVLFINNVARFSFGMDTHKHSFKV